MSFRPFLGLGLSAVLLSGCVSVRPLIGAEQVPVDQRVTLVPKSKWVGTSKVDGENRGYGVVGKFEIRPGLHRITYTGMTNGYMVGTTIVDFERSYDFQPGHTYEIRNAPTGGPFAVQVVDQQTNVELVPVGTALSPK